MNVSTLHKVFNDPHIIDSIKYNDGTIDNLHHIKKIKKKIRLYDFKLLYLKNQNNYYKKSYHQNNNNEHKYIIKQLNKNTNKYNDLKYNITNKINDIETIIYEIYNIKYFIKMKNGKIHNDYGPAIIEKQLHKLIESYYINGKKLSKKDWEIYTRKLKINKLKDK